MDWDELAEQQSQKFFLNWLRILRDEYPQLVLKVASKHRPGKEAIEASDLVTGSFNISGVLAFEDGIKVVVRFPIMGRSIFRV